MVHVNGAMGMLAVGISLGRAGSDPGRRFVRRLFRAPARAGLGFRKAVARHPVILDALRGARRLCSGNLFHVGRIFHCGGKTELRRAACDGRSGPTLFEGAQGRLSLGVGVRISACSYFALRWGDGNDVLNAGDERHVLGQVDAQHGAQREEPAVAPRVSCGRPLGDGIRNDAVFSGAFGVDVRQQGVLHVGQSLDRFPTLLGTLLPSGLLQRPRARVVRDRLAVVTRPPPRTLLHPHDFLNGVPARVSLPLPLLAHSLEAAEEGAAAAPRRVAEGHVGQLKRRGRRRGGGRGESWGGRGCRAALLAGKGDTLVHGDRSQAAILDMQVGTYLEERKGC